MWSSASLDRIGVREIGRRCLLMSLIGLCFGTGTTSASFQEGGRRDSWNEELRIAETGPAKRSAFSFNNHAGIPSGPCALEGLSADSFIKVENSDIIFTAWLSLLACGGSKGLWVRGSKICIGVRNGRKYFFPPHVNQPQVGSSMTATAVVKTSLFNKK